MNCSFQLETFDRQAATRLRSQPDQLVYVADVHPGYPCRQCLRDADVGEELILVSYDPFTGDSPYRSPSPIFLHRQSCAQRRDPASVPAQLQRRQLSVRAFDDNNMMVDASVIDGSELANTLEQFLSGPKVDHVDIHNATRGCWAARARRRRP